MVTTFQNWKCNRTHLKPSGKKPCYCFIYNSKHRPLQRGIYQIHYIEFYLCGLIYVYIYLQKKIDIMLKGLKSLDVKYLYTVRPQLSYPYLYNPCSMERFFLYTLFIHTMFIRLIAKRPSLELWHFMSDFNLLCFSTIIEFSLQSTSNHCYNKINTL